MAMFASLDIKERGAIMDKIKFVSIETWELFTTQQLLDFYNNVVTKEETNYNSFTYWLSCCMTRNNGSLEEVTQITKTFYKTSDGYCYSINEQMISTDITTELSDLYFDCAGILDEIALRLSIHTFEELMDNYYLRVDDFNHDEIQTQLCKVLETDRSNEELENLVKLMIDSTFFE